MNILALETATDNCSVALAVGDDQLSLSELAPQKHAQKLLPMVEQLLAEAGLSRTRLDGVAFGRGPGSFTGLRIAAATTQGIALGLDLPVVGISTLAAIAHQRYRTAQVEYTLACLDARMSEVYWGFFKSSTAASTALQEERVGSASDLVESVRLMGVSTPWEVAGSGTNIVQACLEEQHTYDKDKNLRLFGSLQLQPQALDILLLAQPGFVAGDVVTAAEALPVYLREQVALTEKERLAKKGKTAPG